MENGLNPFEYLTFILTNMPNLGKASFVESIKDLLPDSTTLPQKIFIPGAKDKEPVKYAWEEE